MKTLYTQIKIGDINVNQVADDYVLNSNGLETFDLVECLIPIIENSVMKESATQEEIAIYNIEKDKQISLETRNNLLKQGVFVTNKTKTYFFNESYIKSFQADYNIEKELGNPSIEWKDITKSWQIILLADALIILKDAKDQIKQIYKDN